jgi:enoyl-CoA hydratase/carnithine racemase
MREITLRGRGPNTMSMAMLELLERDIDAAGTEPILITGEGGAFSAGLDLDALTAATPKTIFELLRRLERIVQKLFLHPAPTLALVNGHAVAGGCLLVQCCDLRIATNDPSTRIGMTGVAIGLIYPPFVTAVFKQKVPTPHVETVLLGAERYAPDSALALGLLDAIAPVDTLRDFARTKLEARAKLPAHAYAATKRALREHALASCSTERERFERDVLPSWTHALLRTRQ